MQYKTDLSIAALLLQEERVTDFNPWEQQESKPAIDFLSSSVFVEKKHAKIEAIREQLQLRMPANRA